MANDSIDTDGFTQAQRRYLVDRARANMRARYVEQSPQLYMLYELYVAGVYNRQQLWAALDKRRANDIPKSSVREKGAE